ncbi:hypothetical protein [Parafrankia soli]|uniref:hypothetical protein n=1 Tax=Parafrankia soli TaxID=2599596 RepID=UPI001041C5C4|nr:hypothetical protein [Parafrankia soli]
MAGKEGMDKGADLERRYGRLEFTDGSFVRLRWPVHQTLAGRRRTITDVDVLSLDFDTRLRPTLSIAECKSVKGQSGEMDRLLWLAGLKKLVRADRAVLVRESVTASGRDLARALGIFIMGGQDLGRREADQTWVPETFGSIGVGPHAEPYRKAGEQLKAFGDIPPGLITFLRHDAIVADPHQVLGALSTLSDVFRTASVLPEAVNTIIASDVLMALLLAALRAAGSLDALGEVGLEREIEQGLATGDPRDRQVLKVLELADAVMREQLSALNHAYVVNGADPIEWKSASLREATVQTPAWLPRFYDLAVRYRQIPAVARQLPQSADLVLYDAMHGGTTWKAPAFDHLFTPQHRQLLVVALDALSNIVPRLADSLAPIFSIPFERSSPAVPDRRAPAPRDLVGPTPSDLRLRQYHDQLTLIDDDKVIRHRF